MKKALSIIMALLIVLTLCACGGADSGNTDSSITPSEQKVEFDSKESYVGTWKKDRTDEAPFAMSLTFNEDGTGLHGSKTKAEWSYDEATRQITVTYYYNDGTKSKPTTAKIKEDGKLYWDNEFKVKTADGSTVEVEQVVFNRVK